MPDWSEVLKEINNTQTESSLDIVRRKYLEILSKYTNRNVIAYYSAFLQRGGNVGIDDNDKNAFMQAIVGLDKRKGLDLILHTPGGNIAATESIVDYLKSVFGNNIRVIVPQIAMSAGTMIALSSKTILMGKQSNLGPIDPQFGGISCWGVIEEFDKAVKDATTNPSSIPIWQTIISKYHPTFIGDCQKAIKWSEKMVQKWLESNMFKLDINGKEKAKNIVNVLGNHSATYNHSRHISITECQKLGIKIKPLESFKKNKIENCNDLQDCVLTIHHAYMQSFSCSKALKIVENHKGNAMIISGGDNNGR